MKDVILVPKGKSPLAVLAEMGEQTKEAWIFMHDDVIKSLREMCDEENFLGGDDWALYWYGTSIGILQPPCKVFLSARTFEGPWKSISCIKAIDIAFNKRCDNPKEIIFLKMAD